jgi:hypothetical protein
MDRSKLLMALVPFVFIGAVRVLPAQDQQTVDATGQMSRPARGRGPFPGSAGPGHSAGLPIRLELLFPTGELRPDGTALVDFIITNIGTEPIGLPSSAVISDGEQVEALTLWFTSDAITDQLLITTGSGRVAKIELVETSAELDGHHDDAKSLYVLAPNKSLRIRASSRVHLKPGTHSFTAHAELGHLTKGTSEIIGTADSDAMTRTLSTTGPNSR